MNYVNDLLSSQTIIGEIAARPGDVSLHANLHRAVGSLEAGRHLLTLFTDNSLPNPNYKGYESTTHLRFEPEDIRQKADCMVAAVTGWMVEHCTDVVVTPANLGGPDYRLTGTIAMRAALRAASDMHETINVLELHDTHGWQGNWLAPNAYASIPSRRHSARHDAARARQPSTYSRRRIRGVLLTQHAEALMAAQTS